MIENEQRLWSVLAVAVVLLLAVTACGGGESGSGDDGATPVGGVDSPAGEVSISYLTHWPPEQVERLEEVIGQFEEDHPNISIEVRAVPFGNLLSTLRTQGSSPEGPTMAGIYDLWLPELVRDGIAASAPESQTDEIQDNWPSNVVDAATVDGQVYGYPNEVDLYALNYHQDLFEEAGLAGAPTTWEELSSYAQDLTEEQDGQLVQQGFGIINSWPAGVVHPFASLVASNGGQLISDGEPQLDSPEVIEAAKLYDRLVNELGVTEPSLNTANANTTGPYLDNFANGRTAMIIMANWWESALQDAMGDSFSNVATAPVPVGPSGEESRSISYSWLNIVNANATEAEQDAAWTFQQWLNSPDSGEGGASAMGDLLMAMGILPSRGSDVDAHAEELNTQFLSGYVSELEDAQPFPIILGGEEFTQMLQQQLEAIMFGEAEPTEAMETAQQRATDILEQASS